MRRPIVTFLSLWVVLYSGERAAPGQDAPPAGMALPSSGLLEDVDVLERIFKSAHPGLYRYNTKTEIDQHFAGLRAHFARDRSLAEAYVVFSEFLAQIRCGHTYANFFNQPRSVVQALFAGKNRVPFCFRWLGNQMVVTRDLSSDHRLAPGSEVLSINGVPSSEILSKLMRIARADGSNDAKRIVYLEVSGNGKYEAFDIFLPLYYPAITERMELRVKGPTPGEPITINVAAQDMEQRKALAKESKESQRGEAEPLWRFERRDDRTAYLKMPSWALYNSTWDWRSFLERGMDELIDDRVAGLIVDLRGNEGGQDIVGTTLLARIVPTEVRFDRYKRYTRYRKWPLPKSFDAYLDTWDWSFKDWGEAAREDRNGFFRMTKFDDDDKGDVIKPHGRRFVGRVVILIDASNSSATFQFAQLVKERSLATLVGQTTGGNQRGINGGAFFFVTLPNSKIEVDLPLVANFVGDGPLPSDTEIPFRQIPDAGIEPDVLISPSIAGIAQGVDAELKAATALLGMRK